MHKHADRLITAAGIIMRLVGLGFGSLWHDEAFTGLVAPLPWSRFWDALLGDVHPPLWYLIERPVVAWLGNTDVALRLPAALCSILALLLFRRLLRGEGGNGSPLSPTRLAALALMAFGPFQIYYAQEARMYAAVTLCAVGLMIGIAENRPWPFAWSCVGMMWLHNLGCLYVLAGLFALGIVQYQRYWIREEHPPDHGLLIWWVALCTGAVVAMPAAVWTWVQATTIAGGYWIVDRSIGAWLYQALFVPFAGHGVVDARLSWPAAVLAMMLAFGGLALGIKRRRWSWLVMGWLPGLLALLISNLIRPVLLGRTLIGASPALYLLAGELFDTARRRWALSLALVPLVFSGLMGHYDQERRGNVGPMVAQIREYDPAVVIHGQTGGYIVMAWHMPEVRHMLWSGAFSGLANAVSEQTQSALGMERVSLMDAPRPAALIYTDYALLSPDERRSMMDEIEQTGATLAYVLEDDEFQRIDLWILR